MIAQTMIDTAPKSIHWFPANWQHMNTRFEDSSPNRILRWGAATFGDGIVMATGFGPSGIVMMHMLSKMRQHIPVFYLQTDKFFEETLTLKDELSERLGLEFIEIHSGLTLENQRKQYGPRLWEHNADLCCKLRKVNPLNQFLSGKKAWITGLRRDQSKSRRATDIVSWDNAHHLVKIAPLATWTREQVWAYIYEHDLPYNALHDQGFPSIGCAPCTQATTNPEEERNGRWANSNKTECGIHIQPDGTIQRITAN